MELVIFETPQKKWKDIIIEVLRCKLNGNMPNFPCSFFLIHRIGRFIISLEGKVMGK